MFYNESDKLVGDSGNILESRDSNDPRLLGHTYQFPELSRYFAPLSVNKNWPGAVRREIGHPHHCHDPKRILSGTPVHGHELNRGPKVIRNLSPECTNEEPSRAGVVGDIDYPTGLCQPPSKLRTKSLR
jgi:hypothetical protein